MLTKPPRFQLALTMALAVVALAVPSSAQLVNGGAESGSIAPWVPDLSGAPSGSSSIIKSVTTQVQTQPPVFPALGSRFFSFATQVAGPAGSFVRLAQTAPVPGAPMALALTGLIQTEFGDFGDVRLELLGASGGVVATAEIQQLVSDDHWSSFFVDVDLPSGVTVASCRVRLTGTVTAGSAINVFWDGLVLGDSPWAKLGPGIPGTLGVPVIDGSGPLLGGEPCSITLQQALPNTTAWFVLGASALLSPFKGGVLVPNPDIFLPLPTSATGELELTTTWPVGVPSGSAFFTQWWVQDPAGPLGFAASRGLQGTAP